MDAANLTDPTLYINRELSLLEFNRRVLAQATDPNTPLLERMRFLCICSRNMDEFFEIRVAGLKQQIEFGTANPTGPDGLNAHETLVHISQYAHTLVQEQYRVFNEHLLPDLEEKGIRFLKRDAWKGKLAEWLRRTFRNDVLPVLSPLGLDPAHPFPRVLNKSLNFIISLEGKDAFGRDSRVAILQAPRSLPRLIRLPQDVSNGRDDFVFLSSIIHEYVDDLFPGMKVTGCYQFRVTRNSDLFVDDEEVDDLLSALRGELSSRQYGAAVRIEVADNCPEHMANFLLGEFDLGPEDLYRVNGPVNLNRLINLPDLVDSAELRYPPFVQTIPAQLARSGSLFDVVRNNDLLLHHPYQSFTPVIDFVRQAASDPNVLAIKQTLYRSGPDSKIVDALVEAARAGKEVVVVIELRARFDEEANIKLATRLQEAGAQIVYGVVGHKTHAKLLLIVRREGKRLRRYAHLGTGNYHELTAKLYTDFGLLTADRAICEDVHNLFMQLTGLGRASRLKKILQSPFTLHKTILQYIDREIEHAHAGAEARITAKMNSLVDPQVIEALYRASQAGVQVDLIVRGICCLRPGVKGISDNIRIISVIGRFLEHHRVFWFQNGGEPQLFCSSADWMGRNFFNRIESCFPIEEPSINQRVYQEGLMIYLSDNLQAWRLQSDGSYQRVKPGNAKPRSAQGLLLEQLGG